MAQTKGGWTGKLVTGIGNRPQRRTRKEEEKEMRGVRKCVELFSENEQHTKMQARRQGSWIWEQQASPLSSLWNSNSRDRRALGHGSTSTTTAKICKHVLLLKEMKTYNKKRTGVQTRTLCALERVESKSGAQCCRMGEA